MEQRKRIEQRIDDRAQPGFGGRFEHRASHGLQRGTVQEGHRHVGGAVGFPEAMDLQHRRMREPGEQLGFVDERSQRVHEGFDVRFQSHRDSIPIGTFDQMPRHELLDGHFAVQRMVPG